jgi:hypothetical protein
VKESGGFVNTADAARFLGFVRADGTPNIRAFTTYRYRLNKQGVPLPTYRRGGMGKPFFKHSDLVAHWKKDRHSRKDIDQLAAATTTDHVKVLRETLRLREAN